MQTIYLQVRAPHHIGVYRRHIFLALNSSFNSSVCLAAFLYPTFRPHESRVDDHTNQRTHGRAAVGLACVRRATFIRGQRYSILPALTSDGIIALDIFEGSVNKEKFIRSYSHLPKI